MGKGVRDGVAVAKKKGGREAHIHLARITCICQVDVVEPSLSQEQFMLLALSGKPRVPRVKWYLRNSKQVGDVCRSVECDIVAFCSSERNTQCTTEWRSPQPVNYLPGHTFASPRIKKSRKLRLFLFPYNP